MKILASHFYLVLAGILWIEGHSSAAFGQFLDAESTEFRSRNVVVSPDGKLAAFGFLAQGQMKGRPAVVLWDLETNKVAKELQVGDGGECLALAFSPDGKRVAAIVEQGGKNLCVWEVETGGLLWRKINEGPETIYPPLAWTNSELLTRTAKSNAGFDPVSGREILKPLGEELIEKAVDRFFAITYLPQATQLFIFHDRNKRLYVLDSESRKLVKEVELPRIENKELIAVSDDGKFVCINPEAKVLQILSVETGRPVWEQKTKQQEAFQAVAFKPDTHLLFVTTQTTTSTIDCTLYIADAVAGKTLGSRPMSRSNGDDESLTIFSLGGLAWTPDGRTLVVADIRHSHVIRFPETTDNSTSASIAPAKKALRSFRQWTSADGRYTVEARWVETDGTNVVLERKNGKQIEVAIKKLSEEDQKLLESTNE